MLEPETVRKMDMYGFRNFELDSFVKFQFRTEQARNACKYVVKDICKTIAPDMETYEANVSADMQLASTIGLVSWVRAPYIHLKPLAGQTKCHHTFDLHYDHAICLPESDAVAPMRIMSVDIETASSNMRQSDPERDCVFQIAACLRTVSGTSDDSERHLFALAPCVLDANKSQAPVEFALHVFNTEDEILLAFAQLVSDSDPDIITGWNVDGFDYHYLFTRAKANGCLREFSKRLARCLSNELYPSIVPEEFKTRAFGSSTFHRLYCPGRINLDLLFYSRRTDKFDSYKLDRVAKEVLGLDKGKLEVSYMQMWKAFEANDAVTMGEVAKYCIWDAELVLLIAIANDVWLRLLEQSRVTFVPIAQLGSRGEQIKTFSQLLRYGHEEGYLLPDETFQKANDLFVGAGGGADWATGDAAAADEERDESGPGPLIDDAVSYSGGYVLDPIVGAYFDFPVNVFDFQSVRKKGPLGGLRPTLNHFPFSAISKHHPRS